MENKNNLQNTNQPGAETPKMCNASPLLKYFRIALSLAVIGLGIYYRNPLGALGLLTLYTAFTGKCGASLSLPRKPGYKIKHQD